MTEMHKTAASSRSNLLSTTRTDWWSLLRLGSPILVGQLAQMSNSVIDTVMAGRASAVDLAGVAIGTSLWTPIFLFSIGLLNATQPIISGHRGAKTFHKIMPVTWNAGYVAFAISCIAALLLTNTEPVLVWIGASTEVAEVANHYLKAFAWGLPAIFMTIALRGLTDGLGQTWVYMSFSIASACINAPLNYILIYGKLGLPAMGGVGCGWATAISSWATLIIFVLYLNRARGFKDYRLFAHRQWPNKASVYELLNLGLPIGFTLFAEASMFSIIALLLAPLGADVVAGHQIALNVVALMFMVPLSLGLALTIRISYLIGASDLVGARRNARSSLVLVLGIALLHAGGLLFFREAIAGFYTHEPAVQQIASLLLVYGALFQLVDVLQIVGISALRGYKDTRVPMLIMLLSFWGIGIPLGQVLAATEWLMPAMGAPGYWIGLTAGLSHAALWLIVRLFWISGRERRDLKPA